MPPDREPARPNRWVMGVAAFGGVLLTIIGVRYLISPKAAARTFGIPALPSGYELHYATGIRNIWLGLLALGCLALAQWRALVLWFAIGAAVCFADAGIAASSTGRWPQVAFHVGCGIGCIVLALAFSRVGGRRR